MPNAMSSWWTAIHGQPARLNGKIIRVSQRRKLAEAIVSIGFATSQIERKEVPALGERVAKAAGEIGRRFLQ